MADGQIEELGLNLSITDGEKFATDLTATTEALDKFDAAMQKIIDKADAINTAFNTVSTGIKSLKDVVAQGVDLKSIDAQLNTVLSSVKNAQAQATSTIVHATTPSLVPSGTPFKPGEARSTSPSDAIGDAMKKAAQETTEATATINEAINTASANTQTQMNAASTAITAMGSETKNVAAQVAADFKTAFEVVAAFQERTLSRFQIGRRGAVATSTMPEEQKQATGQAIDARGIQEMAEFRAIVEQTNTAVAELKSRQDGFNASDKEYKAIQGEINAVQREGVNNLRMLSVEAGNYSDKLKEQIRTENLANKENVGAKSTLSPTRSGVLDAGSESLVRSIQERSEKALSAISDVVAKAEARFGGINEIIDKQVAVERAASEAETAIYEVIDSTVGKSVDYRKAKLREVLDAVTTTTSALIAESRKEVAENESKLAFDQAFAAAEAKIAQAQDARQRALQNAKLGFTDNAKMSLSIGGTNKQELDELDAVKKRALTVGTQDHGLLNELKEIANQAKQTTISLKEEIKEAAEQDKSIAMAARYRQRTQVSGLTGSQVVTGKIEIATESDNVIVRSLARGIQDIQDALALAAISGQAFMSVIHAITSAVQTIISPFVALFNILKSLGESFAGLTRFMSFGFLGGNKAGIDGEAAGLAKVDSSLKEIAPDAERSSKSLFSISEILNSIKGAVSGFFDFGSAAKTATTEMAAGAVAANTLANDIGNVATKAKESETAMTGFMAQFRGGIIEGIGKGIAETIFMSITMGIQNAVFGIGSMISDAFSSAFGVVDDMISLTGTLQRQIMDTKGYDSLTQAEGEATEKAKDLYHWVEQLSILSPFKKDQVMDLLQMGNDMGFTAQGAQVLTQALADFATVAGTGMKGAQGIMTTLGQIRETGTVTMKVVKSLGKEGIDAMPILEKAFGMSAQGIHEALKHSQLDAKTAIEAIVGYIQKDYGGQAAKAGGSVPGLLSSIVDIKDKLLAISIEPAMEKIVKPILLFIASVGQTDEVAAMFENVGNAIKDFATNVEKFLAGAFYLIKGVLDAIPQPIKTFYNEWGKMGTILQVGALVLLALPPILGLVGVAVGALLSPISLLAAAMAAFSLSYQDNLFGVREITDSVMAAMSDAWTGLINGGFATFLSYLGGWYDSIVSLLQSVGDSFSQFPEFLSGVVNDALEVIYELPQGFADVMNSVMEYGSAIVQFFAKGIVAAASYVVKALNYIGSIIQEWLAPHSPPKIVPDLEVWGKDAANIYFKGWTKADMSMFTDLSGMLEKAVGAIRPDGLSANGTKRIRETLASAIQGYKQTGSLDETGLRDVGGRFNNEIIGLTKAYIDAARSANVLKVAQDELKTTTDAYDKQLAPLQSRLKAIQDSMSSFDITSQIKELQNVLSNKFATGDQKAQAQAKMDELNIQKKINDLDAEKTNKTAAIQERINKATEENKVAQDAADLLKERFEQEISMLALQNKKKGAESADTPDKPKKPKKEKLMDVVNTEQPDLGLMDLPALDTSGMGSLSDIMANAKKGMDEAFSGVRDKLKPAMDALNDLKTAANGVVDAFSKGFSGEKGGAMDGIQTFAFNTGLYLGGVSLALNLFVTNVTGFVTKFTEAFNLTEGSISQKITGALDATGVTAAVKKFIEDLLAAPVGFATSFIAAFEIKEGSILEKIKAGLDTTGITGAIGTLKLNVTNAIKEAFGGTGQGEHGKGGSGFGIDLSSIKQSIIDGLNTFDFTGKLSTLKENVKKALDTLFGPGTGESAESLVTTVKANLDLLFGAVKFEDLTTSMTNLVSSVKSGISGIKWAEPLKDIFSGLKDAVIGSIKTMFSLGKGDIGGANKGEDQQAKGIEGMAKGGLSIADTIVNQITKMVDVGVILTAAGGALGAIISTAFKDVAAIISAISSARSSDKDEMTTAQLVGKSVGQAVVGVIGAVFAFIATTDWLGLIKATVGILDNLTKIASDLVLGFAQGIADEILTQIGLIAPNIKTQADAMKKSIDDAIGSASKAIDGALDKLTGWYNSIIDKFKSIFGGGGDSEDTKKGDQSAAFVLSGPKTGKSSVIDTLLAFDQKDLDDKTKEIGDKVVEGTQKGISSALSQSDKDTFAKIMLQRDKEALGIHSPSTVYENDIGLPIGQGVVLGTNRGIKEGGDLLLTTKTSFNASYIAIKTATDSFATTLKAKYVTLKTDSGKIFTDMSVALKKIFQDMADELLRIIDELVKDIIDDFDQMKDDAISDFEDVKKSGIDSFTKLKEDVVTIIQEMDKAIVAELDTLDDKITKALKDVLDALNAVGGIKDQFKKFGTDVGLAFIDGLIAGLKDPAKIEKLKAAGNDLGQTIKKSTDQGTGGGDAPQQNDPLPGVPQARRQALDYLNQLNEQLNRNQISPASYALPSTSVVMPQTVNKTYVLQMNVSESRVESVATNFAILEALAG